MSEIIKLTSFSKGGGCGCKIAPSVLKELLQSDNNPVDANLVVGNESNDDAAVYQIDDDRTILSTTDFFLPIVDDAFDFGRIASANAISDIYAMGGKPIMALAILGWPIDKLPASEAKRVLDGARSICAEAGIVLAGGHTIDSTDPIFGLSVTGTGTIRNLKKNNGAQEGDILFLTKPLGIGILATALKKGLIEQSDYEVLIKNATTLNSIGAKLSGINGVSAMTDVTGFGLLGHLVEMTEGSGLSAHLHYTSIPKIASIEPYMKLRAIPDATFRNWNSYSQHVTLEKGLPTMEAFNLLPDPQTNGGLLLAVRPESVNEVVMLAQANGTTELKPIGEMKARSEKLVYVNP